MFEITDKIKTLLKITDLVLLDIKHINDDKCLNLVGCHNKLELEFAKYLSSNNIDVWIRQVIIPGITDCEQDLLDLKSFLLTLKNVKKIELQPYHNMGKYKWENLGLSYPFENIRPTNSEDISRVKKILNI